MKKGIFLLMAVVILGGMQLVNAQNTYLHWVYWVNDVQHQVTPSELADITADLYGVNGRVVNANQVYRLSSGVTYKIPQPSLFLAYIEKAVQSARPTANSPKDVVDAINGAEKMKWDNNVSVTGVKNYYYSSAHKRVQSLDNYSGEGKNVDFLFIDGKPAFKCDCVNALLNPIPILVVKKKEETTGGLLGLFHNLDNDLPANLQIEKKNDFKNPLPPPEKRKPRKPLKIGNWKIVVPVVAILAAAVKMIFFPHHSAVDTGGPGGAPITPAVIPDPVVPPGGGPGGAPTTK